MSQSKKPNSKEQGTRPYVNEDDVPYIDNMSNVTDKGTYDKFSQGEPVKFSIPQSEMKKPYMNPDYSSMEYSWNPPSPLVVPNVPPVMPDFPTPDTPPQPPPPTYGVSPTPGGGKGGGGGRGKPKIDFPCEGCWGPDNILEYCPGDPPILINFSTCAKYNDPITNLTVYGSGDTDFGQNRIMFIPPSSGNEGDIQYINATTKSRNGCTATAKQKPGCCNCSGVKIGFTSQQMSINDIQTLTATGGSGCSFGWVIGSGGGSLSGASGSSVDYTAPSSNVNCADNPIINLTCQGNVVASLPIAINGFAADNPAVKQRINLGCTVVIPGPGIHCYRIDYQDYVLKCDGTSRCSFAYYTQCCDNAIPPPPCTGCSDSATYGCASANDFACFVYGSNYPSCSGVTDERSSSMKTQGCCPQQLL